MNRTLKDPARRAAPHFGGLGALAFTLASCLAGGAYAQSPLTLSAAIAEVRKNSDETRLITETNVKLDAQKRELWAGALPSVSAYANAGRGHSIINLGSFPIQDTTAPPGSIPPVYGATQNVFSYGIQATQPIYSFGRLGQAFSVANTQIRSQEATNRRAEQQLELQTLDAYYAVVITEARLKVIAASVERQSKTVGFLESNFKRGAGARSTLLLTSASLKGLEPERIRAERDADAARMSLNRLLGRPESSPLTLDTTVLADEKAPAAPGNVDQVVDNRPDIQALSLQKETTKGLATAYRMQYLPALGLSGKVGIMAFELDKQLTDFNNNLEWQIGVGLTWPLFDGLANSSKARQYDSDARTLAINERRARAYARIEIESAQREAEAADTALSAAQQARDASAEALELISQDFRAGAGNVTDLLSAEEGLRGAESGLLAARYQKARAKAALRVALGMNLTEGDK